MPREGDDPYMETLTDLLTRLVTIEDRRRSNPVRPKSIQSRVFKISDNWENFSSHFVECVRAAHGFTLPRDQEQLNEACLSWLPSKLEPGPTLTAYKNLDAEAKATWPLLNEALKKIFTDDTERETFLADVASFKRGKRSLLEYKTELLRLMTTHSPDLVQVEGEFQRNCTSRFIEGLDNDSLKRKLRRHCKREKCTLEEAYNFVLDWETSDVQTRIREGEAAVLAPETKSLSVIEASKITPSSNGSAPVASSGQSDMRRWMENVASKQKIFEMHVQEQNAKIAHTNDRVDCVVKEMGQMAERFDSRFDKLEKMIMGNYAQNANRPVNPSYTQYRGGNRGGYRGGPRGFAAPIRPSLTGGAGYVDNTVRPTSYRMQEPGSQNPVRPVTGVRLSRPESANANPTPNPAVVPAAAPAADVNAAAATSDQHHADPNAHYEEPSWWSPGMESIGAMGYDESYNGTYTYGYDHFQWQ